MDKSNEFLTFIRTIYNAIEDKKGERTVILDISEISLMTDCFIITNGNNVNQVRAIADNIEEELQKQNINIPHKTEGYRNGSWILMDFGNVICHIFNKEERTFYDLERVWRDGKILEKP